MVHNLVYGNPDTRDVGFCTFLMEQIQLFVLRKETKYATQNTLTIPTCPEHRGMNVRFSDENGSFLA